MEHERAKISEENVSMCFLKVPLRFHGLSVRNTILEYFRKKAVNNGFVRATETGPWNYHNKKRKHILLVYKLN